MGIETAKALRARRGEFTANLERLVEAAGNASRPVAPDCIGQEARQVRRWLRRLNTARHEAEVAEVEIGGALLRLLAHGLSHNEAFALVGLPRHRGRRYLEKALTLHDPTAQARSQAAFSTDSPAGLAGAVSTPDLDENRADTGAPVERRP